MYDEVKSKSKYKVISAVVAAKYNLCFISEFNDLKRRYPDDIRFARECDGWISLIYQKNNLLNEALAINRSLLKDPELLETSLVNIVFNTLTMLAEKEDLPEAEIAFFNFIDSKQINWQGKLGLFHWYTQNFETDDKLKPYQHLISSIAFELGLPFNKENIRENILLLDGANRSANLKHMELMLNLQSKDKAGKVKMVDEYINSNPIKFYRNLAEELLTAIHST
jgi:hypothetical protein